MLQTINFCQQFVFLLVINLCFYLSVCLFSFFNFDFYSFDILAYIFNIYNVLKELIVTHSKLNINYFDCTVWFRVSQSLNLLILKNNVFGNMIPQFSLQLLNRIFICKFWQFIYHYTKFFGFK
jgi:hypothetical protein